MLHRNLLIMGEDLRSHLLLLLLRLSHSSFNCLSILYYSVVSRGAGYTWSTNTWSKNLLCLHPNCGDDPLCCIEASLPILNKTYKCTPKLCAKV